MSQSPKTRDDVTIADLRGLRCPLPVLKTRNRLRKLAEGDRLQVLTDDPLASLDIPNFCREYGQPLVETDRLEGDAAVFLIERRGELR